jgi:hypothetical protein
MKSLCFVLLKRKGDFSTLGDKVALPCPQGPSSSLGDKGSKLMMKQLASGASQLDDFPPDLKDIVHPYWGEFPPQHPLITDLFGILFFVLWIVAVLGNGCVILVFLTTKNLRTAVS